MNNFDTAFFSILAGSLASLLAITISGIFDYFLPYVFANFIGIFSAMFINFLLQKKIFIGSFDNNNNYYFIKYLLTDVIILGSNQILFYLSIKHRKYLSKFVNKNYYNLISRMIIGSLVWIVFSFPLRKYWVFKEDDEKDE